MPGSVRSRDKKPCDNTMVPLEYGNPQGRAHTFANAQNQQTASSVVSYFVYAVQDYQLVTITNLLMEQTKNNAGQHTCPLAA